MTIKGPKKPFIAPPSNCLREYRLKKEIRQVDLAEMSGVCDKTIHNIENQVTNPTGLTMNRLANALEEDVKKVFPNNKRGSR